MATGNGAGLFPVCRVIHIHVTIEDVSGGASGWVAVRQSISLPDDVQ